MASPQSPRRDTTAGVSRRTLGLGAAGLAAVGALTGWFAATATDDDTAATATDTGQVLTEEDQSLSSWFDEDDDSSDWSDDEQPSFGDSGSGIPAQPDTSSGVS